ncbi:MAG TPA: hypothetical protein VF600_03550 [Abditibacteriaceae bacterium]|jgi:CheY-like chemotaxis protein
MTDIAKSKHPRGRILFVEDYPDMRALMTFALELAGYEVMAVLTLTEALEHAATRTQQKVPIVENERTINRAPNELCAAV